MVSPRTSRWRPAKRRRSTDRPATASSIDRLLAVLSARVKRLRMPAVITFGLMPVASCAREKGWPATVTVALLAVPPFDATEYCHTPPPCRCCRRLSTPRPEYR